MRNVSENLQRWLTLVEQNRLDEIAAERDVLIPALIAAAHEPSVNKLALQLGLKIDSMMRWRGHWEIWYAVLLNLLLASQVLGDRVAQARLWERVGALYNLKGEQERATAAHKTAHSIADEMNNGDIEAVSAWALAGLIDDARRRDSLDEAMSYVPLAISQARRSGDMGAIANAYMVSANVYGIVCDTQRALEYAQIAYVHWHHLDDRVGMAKALHILGIVYHIEERTKRAMEIAERGASIYKEVDSFYLLGLINILLGNLYDVIDDWERAVDCYSLAERYLEDQDAIFDLAVARQSLGAALARREQWAEAEYYLLRALRTWRQLSAKGQCIIALYELGEMCAGQDRKGEAIVHLTEAMELANRLPNDLGLSCIIDSAQASLDNLQ